MKIKKILFYVAVTIVIFAGQFLYNRGMVTGKPPVLAEVTMNGEQVADKIASGPGIIYFWAEWCRICGVMQGPVTDILKDYPGVTVALNSGDDTEVTEYMQEHGLAWPVINDDNGSLANLYGVKGVPALFIFNKQGQIVFTSVGYSTEFGLKLRLWLAGLID